MGHKKNKKILLVILIAISFLMVNNYSYSQVIEVQESTESFQSGSKNVLSVMIYESAVKDIEKAFKNLMKGYKGKVSVKKEIFVDNATISSISVNTIDVYAKIVKEGLGNRLIVSFFLGGADLSSSEHSSQFKEAKDILKKFAIKTTKEALKNKVQDNEKELSDLVKKGSQLVKDNKKLHSDIAKYKELIIQAKKDIEINLKDQQNNKIDVDNQKKEIVKLKERESSVR